NPASYRVVRKKSYLFNKADLNFHCFLTEQALQLFYLFVVVNKNWSQFHFFPVSIFRFVRR
ncbi:hypothetical protein, partial [Escherichia coli]|uniref:hypothetical protein n=1 Tax=Escherichia coli TaxID=562 RepID=UPI001BC82D82